MEEMEGENDSSLMMLVLFLTGILGVFYLWSKKTQKPVQTTPLTPKTPTAVSKRPGTNPSKTATVPSDLIPLKIFFGSQTGTAEDFSHKLSAEAKQYKFHASVIDLEDYEPEDLENETFVIFVAATYGEGEPTDNSRTFFEWLMAEHGPNSLKGVKYTVFGLGNKTYEHYNYIGRKIDQKMEEYGATKLFKKGEGDDDASIEDDFSAWKKELWPALCAHFNIQVEEKDTTAAIMERRFCMKTFSPESREAKQSEAVTHLMFKKGVTGIPDAKNPYMGKITVNRELHSPQSDRSCRHIEIEIGGNVRYETGDHFGIYPENDEELVVAVANRLQVNLNSVMALYQVGKESGRPTIGPCSIKKILMQWCDLTSQPRKAVLRVLAEYAKEEKDRKFLLELSSDTAETYNRYIKDYQRTILEVLNEFPSIEIPFDHFLEIIPRLKPRMYSISSSPKVHKNSVHVTAVVVQYKTENNRIHKGVCTNWLQKQLPKEGSTILVPVFVEKAIFRLPKDPKVPIVMVGPGTGLAPFRGFIQERGLTFGQGIQTENLLFFGCRHRDIDFIYREELEQAATEKYLSLSVAFSRETGNKVYVQNKMLEFGEKIWDILETRKGTFYVCGDAREMARDVRKALKEIAMVVGKKNETEAEQFVVDLLNTNRYHSDVWS